jgi:rhodanese-related sulfurtransferase
MKKSIIKIVVYLITLLILSLNGCLKDTVVMPYTIELNNTEDLLIYLESKGDYINSPEMPSIIEAEEVYSNLNNYLVIDIRHKEEFITGHIPGSVNLLPEEIIPYLSGNNNFAFQKIVLVSSTGQAAAYYTCLLRLYGVNNSYSMNFGMAYWHRDFADIWIDASKDDWETINGFELFMYPKKDISGLPRITFNIQGSIEEKLKDRVQGLMKDIFEEFAFPNSSNSISVDNSILWNNIDSAFIACFAIEPFYASKVDGIGHPPNSVHYRPPPISPDLRSSSYLQTLPPNERIVLYSYSGQLSAFAAAYLRLLGYNVKTISFGMHSVYYSVMLRIEEFAPYVFKESNIMNYPYETGE